MCDERGIKCTIGNGATSAGNRTVSELKEKTRVSILTKENEKLKDQIETLQYNKTSLSWGNSQASWKKGEDKKWSQEY